MSQIEKVRDDFDKIISLSDNKDSWGHNNHYHKFLLGKMPSSCENVFDIGCGTGEFARLLAKRSKHVLGLDISSKSIEIAKEQSKNHNNISYEIADVMEIDFPDNHFDCIASLATFHHLPFEEMLMKIRKALKVNGVLLILDLYKFDWIRDMPINLLAMPTNFIMTLIRNGYVHESKEVKEAWNEHYENEHFLTISNIHKICDSIIPKAKIRKHLYWRYSLIWTKK